MTRPEPARLGLPVVLAVTGAVLAAAAAAIALGPVALPPGAIVAEIVDRLPLVSAESGLDPRHTAVLWDLRMPRVALGALVGAMLASAGAAYQGVFRNPLADPYLLGVAAGAGLGATLAITLGAGSTAWLVTGAFAGGIVAVVVTYSLGRVGGGRTATLILAGVAVASFFTALQTYVQQRSADTVREVFAWILGRLTTGGWNEVRWVAPVVAVTGAVLWLHRRRLDVLAVGEEEAGSLGIAPDRVRWVVVVAATLGTAAVVAVSGLIGFVGIIVPHAVRLIAGWSYRVVLPLSFLAGAGFLVLADLVARTIVAPAELPIGVITAFVGAPFFALVLWSVRSRTA